MSKGLAGLISVLGAAGSAMSGYAKGRQQFQAGERQKMLDGREDEDYEFRKAERDKAKALEQSLIDSQADVAVEEVPGVDPNYNPASMAGLPEPGTPAPAPAGFKVGAQTFGDRGAAQQALHGVNSQASKDQRAAEAYRKAGQLEQARKFEDFSRNAIKEGADQILGAISATAPKVQDVKKAGGMVAGTIGAEAAEIFNKTGGKWRVTADTMVQHFIDKDAAGREFTNSRVLGKDGKPVVEDVRAAGMMLADFKTRLAQQNADTDTFQKGQQITETVRSNKAGESLKAEDNRAQRAAQAASLGIQQQRLNMERQQFKKQTPAGQIAALEEAIGAKLSDADKKSFLGISKKGGGDEAAKATDKLVDSLTEKFAEINSDPAAVVQYRASLHKMIGAQKNNGEVENVVKSELGKHAPDSPGYAATYAEAKTALGMTDAALAALGYKAPKAAPARMAAKAGTAAAPAAPGKHILNEFKPHGKTTEARKAQEADGAAQEKQAQRAMLMRNVAQIEKTLAAGAGNALFQQTAKAKLARYQNELLALEGLAGQ